MKRLPGLVSFILFIVLCVSLAFWAMQFFKPAPRAVIAPPPAAPSVDPQAAAALFGGRSAVALASNFQLKGVVAANDGRDSVAILSANGKPAQAVRQGAEIVPGAVVKEVHRSYVLVSDGGVPKRVELPVSAVPTPSIASPAGSGPPSAPLRPNPPNSPPAAATLGAANPVQQLLPQPTAGASPTATEK